MEFLKNNYEKVILSVVLIGLAIAAVFLLTSVDSEKRSLEEIESGIIATRPKGLKPVDLSTNETALQRLLKPPSLRLVGEHNLFNPVTWKKMPDGRLLALRTGRELGQGFTSAGFSRGAEHARLARTGPRRAARPDRTVAGV